MDETLASGEGQPTGVSAGTQLGKYKLLRPLGAGAMGQVWAAHDPDLERQIAVKLLKSDKAAPQLRTRLLREARAMARLKHANVLTVYEVGTDDDRDYIVMELVDGANLDQWLALTPPVDDVWTALFAAGRGLAAAHRAGLVHRDFKPHNVLRSSDGRVLVTDFGLARGVSDEPGATPALPSGEVALSATLDVSSKDSLLDSPLTQTGALIGTPAYMAPEQYVGGEPDPRTDQFAFCVTAWQALTGERPFHGTTLDELRRATNRGVAGIKTKLSPRVRAVLARGLDPDPAKRWSSMDDLLDALERARKPHRLRPFVPLVIAFIGSLALAVSHKNHAAPAAAPSPTGCVDPERAFALWNDDARAALQNRVGAGPSELVSRYLDEYRTQWIAQYSQACKGQPTPKTYAEIACLLACRDDAALFIGVVSALPPTAFPRMDVTGTLSRPLACMRESPVGPPQMPEVRNGQVHALATVRVEVAMLRYDTPRRLVKESERWEKAAASPGWEPLIAKVDLDIARAAEYVGEYDVARTHAARAADRAQRLRDFELEAAARLALLEIESQASADPSDPTREATLAKDAHEAVDRAGGDEDLASAIDQTLAKNRISRFDIDGAVAALNADPWSASVGQPRAAVRTTALRLQILVAQHRYEEAYALGKKHETDETLGGPVHAEIEREMIDIARRAGNLDDAHARADVVYGENDVAPPFTLIHGEVRDARGAPISHARVVAWRHTLEGDGRRLFMRPDFVGATDTTDDRGHYSMLAPSDGAIMAERDDLRSPPIAVPDGKDSVVLVLGPTHGVEGKIPAGNAVSTLDAFVELHGGEASWRDRVPVAADGTYRIAGIPAHSAGVGLVRREADGEHVVTVTGNGATLSWPTGATLDVIVKKPGTVCVTRGKSTLTPGAQGCTSTVSGTHSDFAGALTGAIGFSSTTTEGRASYTKDKSHAVLRDISPGQVTVCTTGSQTCTTVMVPASGTIPVALE